MAALEGSNYQGLGAEGKLAVVRAINSAFSWAGVTLDPSDLGNAGKLQSALFVPVMTSLKSVDSTPTQQQQTTFQQMVGSLSTSPEALPKMLDMMEERLTYGIKTHNSKVDRADKEGAPVGPWRIDTIEDLNRNTPSKEAPPAPKAWKPPQGWKFETR
jgi:hypothetical protein